MPTLYDNFERVRQYIDQHQADVDLSSYVSYSYLESKHYLTEHQDLSSYVTKTDLSNAGYVTNEVTQLDGPLFISYQTANNAQYTLNAYSHIIAGTEDKTGVSLVATKRKCGGAEGTSYMASFFTNSDGRSKFAHKSKISATEVGGQSDDAFMCFNAYGFRIAYSGEQGVAASTEYEILHEGNIGNLGYITMGDVSNCGYITAADIPEVDLSSYVTYDYLSAQGYVTSVPVIDENLIPKENATYTLGDADHLYARTYTGSIQSASGGMTFRVGSSNTITIGGGDIRPSTDGAQSLGRSANHWNNGYINNIYTNTAYLQDTSYTKSIVPAENDSYTLGASRYRYATTYTHKVSFNPTYDNEIWNAGNYTLGVKISGTTRYYLGAGSFTPQQNNITLGGSSNKWAATYTSNLYADTIHNFIWTGTSAEYAALDNYTSYQIYMIKEA